ncbi:MAG: sialate O-acetylesterase [Treponema sp.]|nr:sialate O-acetylesterase [Treponema sp.]MCL2251941.1 sialate O-acetylesterase [Treponema sp.]
MISPIISSGMIMQRDAAFPIWSKEKLIVSFLGKKYESKEVNCVSNEKCKWLITLDPVKAGGPFEMEIATNETSIKVNDIYSGDVWLCAGQSNMEMMMNRLCDDFGEEWEIIKDSEPYDFSLIRQFKVPQTWDFSSPNDELTGGQWLCASEQTLDQFSGTAWFFAKEFYKKYRIPVALIMTAWGGTPIESWMSEEALRDFPLKIAEGKKYADNAYREEITNSANKAVNEWETNTKNNDIGNTQQWQKQETDISDWKVIFLPGDFSSVTELKSFCGAIWLAKDFTAGADFASLDSKVWLGTIVDADTVYINGTEIGNTGYRYPPRKYVPKGLIKQGRNRIVIRVTCNNGEGSVTTDKPFQIFTNNETIELSGTWKYKIGCTSPARPSEFFFQRYPLGNYNAMISPVLKFPLKGVIWYQGESNEASPYEYEKLFKAMILNWRKNNSKELPFLFVQLPLFCPVSENNEQHRWAVLREMQAASLSLPETGMAAALDLGEWNDIHPINKKDVGIRLFLAADKLLFGASNSSPGPMLHKSEIRDKKLYLYFDNCAEGLTTKAPSLSLLTSFAISKTIKKEDDNVYVSVISGDESGSSETQYRLPSEKINGNEIIIDLSGIKNPEKILYAWADNPKDRQLYNSEGLPALPFKIELTKGEKNV